jgi:hypothetical protein
VISKTMARDTSFDTLLDLDGSLMVLDDAGYWVKFAVRRVRVAEERPHGLDYEIALHDPQNHRIAGFDNAHSVPKRSGPSGRTNKAHDHKHRFKTITAYDYADPEALVTDFWELVESVLRELGAWK